MSAVLWKPSPIENPERFAQASRQVHSLVQWLARMQRSFSPQQDADEPIRLNWREARRAIETLPLGDNLSLELRLPEMVLQFLEDGVAVSHPFEAEDHSPAHVEAWLLVEMLHRGIDRSGFSKALPYDISGLMSGDGSEFAPEAYLSELEALTRTLAGAADLLAQAADAEDPEGAVAVRPDDLSLEATSDGRNVIGFRADYRTGSEPVFYLRPSGDASVVQETTLQLSKMGAELDAANLRRLLGNDRDPAMR